MLKMKIIKYLNNIVDRKRIGIIITSIIVIILFLNIFISNAFYRNDNTFVLIHSKVGKVNNNDYVLLVYLEDSLNSGKYHLEDNIPNEGYTYSGYNCENDSTLIYNNDEHTATVELSKKESCSMYFNVS